MKVVNIMKRSRGEKVFNIFNVIIMAVFLIVICVPIIIVLRKSFDAGNQGDLNLSLFPAEFSLLYYKIVMSDKGIYRPFLNSAYITIVGTSLSVFLNAMGAYSLSKKNLPGNKYFMYMIIFSMMFSGGLVPSYLLIKNLGMINTYWSLILPGAVSGMNLILLRNYYNSIPISLSESAKIDGAEEYTVFFKIILPLSAPIIAAVSLFTGVGYWNTFFSAILYINDPKKYPFTVKLQEMIIMQQAMQEQLERFGGGNNLRQNLNDQGVYSAIVVISTIPIIIVYPFLQKHFTKGIMLGSIKG
jgi:putative aldouronate transport system permease protein